MGMSASASIYYGVDLGESDPYRPTNPHEKYSEEWDAWEDAQDDREEVDGLGEFLALRAGHKDPWDNTPEGYSYNERHKFPEFEKATDDWYKLKESYEDRSPVELAYYGSYDWNCHLLVLKSDRYQRSAYQTPEKFEPLVNPMVTEVEEAALFCAKNGLPDFKDAAWILSPSYG